MRRPLAVIVVPAARDLGLTDLGVWVSSAAAPPIAETKGFLNVA